MSFEQEFDSRSNADLETLAVRGYLREMETNKYPMSDNFPTMFTAETARYVHSLPLNKRVEYAARYLFELAYVVADQVPENVPSEKLYYIPTNKITPMVRHLLHLGREMNDVVGGAADYAMRRQLWRNR